MNVRNLNLKKLVVAQILIIGLLIASLGYVVAQSGTTFTISQGIYPGTPDYTIWREDSTYYAKDAYGVIPSWGSGTNITAIFDNVKNVDGRVHFKAGTYEVGTRMVIDSTLEVSGVYGGYYGGTVFKPTGNNDVFMIAMATTYHAAYLHDFSIIDSDQVQTSTSAIHIPVLTGQNPRSLIFENLFIRGVYFGIVTEDIGHGSIEKYPHGVIKNVEFMGIRATAIRLHRSADWFINNVMVDNANTIGVNNMVSLSGAAVGITVDGLTILGKTGAGMLGVAQLELEGTLIFLSNIIIDGSPTDADGIWISSTAYHIYMDKFHVTNVDDYGIGINGAVGGIYLDEGSVTGSGINGIGINSAHNESGKRPIVFSNLWLYNNDNIGIYAFGTNSSKIYIDNCRVGDDFFTAPTQDYALNIAGGSYPNEVHVTNSDFRNNNISNIGGTFTNLYVENTKGFVTENSDTSTGTGGEQTIAHGLAGTPDIVLLSPPTTNAYESSAADATNIYITADNTEAYYWAVEYKP